MRNALLPPVSSHLYNFGNNEVQMPNLDVSTSMDGKINLHATSFYLDSKVFNDEHQLRDGGFSIPNYQYSLANYQPVADYQSVSSTCNNISQQSMLLTKRVSIPEVQMDFQAKQTRKRSITELNNLLLQRGHTDLIENKTFSTWKTNKRKKANSPKEPWKHQARESVNIQEQKFQMPNLRRSQKLSDKITALQKLVSPYGKTDTASVLQEASLYIKLLQEQIQNLFQMLTSSYINSARPIQQSQEIDGKLLDLQSRGLCLVPISFMQKMTQQQDQVHPSSCSRRICARNF